MNHPPSEVLLTAEDLTVSSGSTTLLNKVSFSLFRGKTLGVIGPSGSGKTMIANVLMQLLPAGLVAKANNLHLLNESTKIDLLTPQKGLRGKVVAMVFQDSYAALNPVLTIGQQLIETILMHQNLSAAEALAAARVWLQKVNLTEHAVILQAYPHQLSGGQRQRIMIALALVGNPSIVIADEPTSSLDRQNQALIVSLLQSLQAELQFALVFISHDEQLVETIADDQLRLAGQVQSSRVLPKVVDVVAELPRTRVLVALSDVSFSYPKAPGLVLDRVNLQVYEKQTVGIVGASGSGKSTIAKLLMGLETPNSGNISYPKMDVDLAHFRQIVFQDATTALNPRLKIQSCLADLSAEPTTIQAMVEAVGLPLSVLQKYPNQLSGGQKQRVAIARSLLLRPQLLICDEIVSALDLTTQNRIIELLQQLKIKQQMSYLFISHDLALVQNFCDTAYELVEGTCRKLF